MAPPPGAPVLSASTLALARGERLLFRGLDFTLPPGRIVWLRGRNGRGKTSLLRLLAGLCAPAHGYLQLDGRSLRQSAELWRTRRIYVAHANALKDDLTVAESLQFLARMQGDAVSADAITAALEQLGMRALQHAPVRTLSQGQRRRAALARLALAGAHPGVWLLDEPYDALDDQGTQALNTLLAAHARRGGSALIASHLPVNLRDPVPGSLNLDDYAVVAG
jgi:heme exporter protein A